MSSAAQSDFAQATDAFRRGDYAAAARLFLRAYEADPQADILYNVALSHHRGRRVVDAASHYRRYLRLSHASSGARGRAVEALRAVAPSQLGELGDDLFDGGRYADARAAWAAWRDGPAGKAPRPFSAQRARAAEAALRAGRHYEAFEAYEALFVATGNADMLYQAARAREGAGDLEGARASYATFCAVRRSGPLHDAARARVAALSPRAAAAVAWS